MDDLGELKQRISDLTRQLDESPAAEKTPEIEAEMHRLTELYSRKVNALPTAEQVVMRFCEAWGRRDIDELVGYFTADAIYHNMPLEPAQGHDAIRTVLGFFVPTSEEISFEIVHMASKGDVVLTERLDRFRMGGKEVVLPVAGTFEVKAGKIAVWRDYFDMQAWASQTSGQTTD